MAEEPKEYVERRITLTKDFHKTYWDLKDSARKYQIMIAITMAVGVVAIIGVQILNIAPKGTESIAQTLLIALIYLGAASLSFSVGYESGVGAIGGLINHQIEEEYPDYHKEEKLEEE